MFATNPALPIPCTAQISCLSEGAPLISTDPMISPAAHRPLPQRAMAHPMFASRRTALAVTVQMTLPNP